MSRSLFLLLVSVLFLNACGGAEPASPSTPVPTSEPRATSTPEPSPTPEAAMTPELLFEITNEPDGLKDPYGIAVNSEGLIYVTDSGNSRVLVFDNEGNLRSRWDAQGSGEGQFHSLGFGGLAIDSSDNVFVVDNGNHRIQKFDKDGNFLLQWGSEGTGDGQFVRAIGIATDKDGNVYVTDDGNPFVQKFDSNGSFLMKFGNVGTGDGQFSHATGIAVDGQGNIFVADYENKRVQKFDSAGTFISTWNMGADINVAGIPEAIAVTADGTLFISDYSFGRLQIFDNDGSFLWALGGKSITKSLFKRPTGIAFDKNGRMLVVNQSGNSVSVYQLPYLLREIFNKWLYNILKMVAVKVPTIDKRKRIPQEAIDQVVEQIVEKFKPQKIILFGSYARGNPRPESDVDMLVVMNTRLREVQQAIQICQQIEYRFGLDLIVHTPKKLMERTKMGDWFLRDVLKEGKVLYESRSR